MKIQFIGTGTMGSITRNNTSLVVDDTWLFDCGMGTIKSFERMGGETKLLRNVVISHYHADHFFDMLGLLWERLRRHEEPMNIIGPIGIRQKVYDMMDFSFGDIGSLEELFNINFVEMAPDESREIGGAKLTALEMKHGGAKPNYGYLFEKDDLLMGYTGDTTLCDNLYKMCASTNYLVAEASSPDQSNDSHLGINDLKHLANQYIDCRFFVVHRKDQVPEETGCLILPNDGDIIMLDKHNWTTEDKSTYFAGIVVGALLEKDGQYLFVQERKTKASTFWNWPMGRLEALAGETVIDGAIREVKEETGYKIEPNGLLPIQIHQVPNEHPRIRFIFTAKITGQDTSQMVADEIAQTRWLSLDQLQNMKDQLRFPEAMIRSVENYENSKIMGLDVLETFTNRS